VSRVELLLLLLLLLSTGLLLLLLLSTGLLLLSTGLLSTGLLSTGLLLTGLLLLLSSVALIVVSVLIRTHGVSLNLFLKYLVFIGFIVVITIQFKIKLISQHTHSRVQNVHIKSLHSFVTCGNIPRYNLRRNQ
jgi:hypothetical protein